MVGKCFLSHAEHMKKVYTDYCINNDKAEQLLEKYETIKDVQRVLQSAIPYRARSRRDTRRSEFPNDRSQP